VQDHLSLLIVGGYGTFGGRIVELLESEPRLALIGFPRATADTVASVSMSRSSVR